MEKIGTYHIMELIAETRGSIIYRGEAQDSGQAVTIKILKAQYPSPSEIVRFKKEYELICQANIDGVLKTLEIVPHENSFALVLEYFNAINLKEYLNRQKPAIDVILDISIQLATILDMLHKKNIVHRDIKPQNILINPETLEVRITDFGIASELTGENLEVFSPEVVSGTLLYMSPEQTGRMNRPVDYRTDFYSLGVTLYYLLTGKEPFISSDPLEIIHSHIAKTPVLPHKIDPKIPRTLSAIAVRLMAKSAEERYQNATGLLHDLIVCREYFKNTHTIPDFELGTQDISIKFNIPQKVFGRAQELNMLMHAFERASAGGREVVLVSGQPGIGKSAFIQEIYKPVTARKGYFISGKYEQFRRDVPYSALIQAFKRLIKQILCENEKRLAAFRSRILTAVGPNAKIITDVFPDMELIIGPQPDVTKLDPEEAHNRFNLVFRQFIRVFCSKESPLVLFIDDLQWADNASEKLIKTILTDPEQKYFLLIGAYRDTEMGPADPFLRTMEEINKQGLPVTNIGLQALEENDVADMIANFMRCDVETVLPLAEIVHKKTNGNPFFIHQFLKDLYDENMLTLNTSKGWTWDIGTIKTIQVTDNVIELLTKKITTLPAETLEVLKVCSVAGDRFDLNLIADILEISIEQSFERISLAIDTGFISRVDEGYMFHHDRIQEAVYSLITDKNRVMLHYRIGNIFLMQSQEAELPERIFDIVNQLNLATPLILAQDEKLTLAKLNLMAGEKARNSNAYAPATLYTSAGIELLPDDAWDKYYELSYELHLIRMQCEYLCYNFEHASRLFGIIIEHARSLTDKARAYNPMIYLKISQAEYEEAVKLGLDYLAQAGIKLSRYPSQFDVLKKLAVYWNTMRGHTIEDMLELPQNEDPEKIAHNQVFMAMNYPAYFLDPNLFATIAIERNLHHFEEGTMETTGPSLTVLSTILGPGMGFHHISKRYMDVVNKLMQRYPDCKEQVPFLFGSSYLLDHWYAHARKNVDTLRRCHRLAIQHGNIIIALHSATDVFMVRGFIGDNLEEAFNEFLKYESLHKISDDDFAIRSYENQRQFYHSLQALCESRTSMNDEGFDTEEHARAYLAKNNILGLFFLRLNQLKLLYLFEAYDAAFSRAQELEEIVNVAVGTYSLDEFYFFYALSATGLYRQGHGANKALLRRKINTCLKKIKLWSGLCEENFLHQYYLILAEKLAWVDKKHDKALYYYQEAITLARKNSYTNFEAIAAELTGRFFLERGYQTLCKFHIQIAWQAYHTWGAKTKVMDLEERYPEFIDRGLKKDVHYNDTKDFSSMSTKTQAFERVDLRTVIKTSQALSSEINLDRLIDRLLAIAMENAAAQSGALLLERDGDAQVVARTKIESVPMNIINYVRRTGEFLILGNARTDKTFGQDQTVIDRGIQSILCLPVKEQSRLIGTLYLENNLTTDAFTPERIEILDIITSQAAISIKNAMLYSDRTVAQEQLLAQKERLSVTLRSIGDGVIATDTQDRITLMNKVAEELSGWTQENALGKPFAHVMYLYDNRINKTGINPLKELLSTGKPVQISKSILQGLHGQERMVEINISPIWDQGRIIGSIVVIRDITQRNKMEEELLKSQKLESLSIFAGGIAHDFNNLLTGIIGNASLAMRQAEPESKIYKRLAMLEKTGLRAKDLTQQLLTFAKGGDPIRKNISIIELIQETAHFALSGSSVLSDFDVAESLWSVEVDEGQINQVLNNLIINARQAMPNGGKIRIRAKNTTLSQNDTLPLAPGKYVRIEIQDEGTGISEENLLKIFDPFFTTKATGNGLGLSSTFSIIQKHGGHIGVSSQIDVGTTFTIHLPASQESPSEQKADKYTDSELKPGNVLLMDDDETIRDTGKDILTQLGFQVETASEGSEAIELYKQALEKDRRFDFLILDLTVPGGWGGVEVIKRLKEIDPDVKAIASSGYSNDPVLTAHAKYGFDGIVTKPYVVDDMAEAIKKIQS